jgi:chromosome segregation ATPase
VSDSGESRTDSPDGKAFGRLETAVARLLKEHAAALGRVRAAEARLKELDKRLNDARKSGADPVHLQETITQLRERNAELEKRIDAGRAGVDRLLSRVRFLEERIR